jgi:hypothetical protein
VTGIFREFKLAAVGLGFVARMMGCRIGIDIGMLRVGEVGGCGSWVCLVDLLGLGLAQYIKYIERFYFIFTTYNYLPENHWIDYPLFFHTYIHPTYQPQGAYPSSHQTDPCMRYI